MQEQVGEIVTKKWYFQIEFHWVKNSEYYTDWLINDSKQNEQWKTSDTISPHKFYEKHKKLAEEK